MTKTYKNYHFRGQDPLLRELLVHYAQSGMTKAQIERKTGVCPSTIRNWERKKTLRPYITTLQAVYKALGLELRAYRINR